MNKQTEALKLALEALKELRMLGMNAQWHDSWLAKPNEAITAIREALSEQPAQQQEPVCDKDPQGCWSVRCQLGKVCKNKYRARSGWIYNGYFHKDCKICGRIVSEPIKEEKNNG